MRTNNLLFMLSVFALVLAVSIKNHEAIAESLQEGFVSHQEFTVVEPESFDGESIVTDVQYAIDKYSVPQQASQSLEITMSRTLAARRHGGSFCYQFTVKSKARTQTNICADNQVYVLVRTAYPGGQTAAKSQTDSWFCKDDTGFASVSNTFAQGTNNVRTKANHTVKHQLRKFEWLNVEGPSTNLPIEPSCIG